MQEITLTSIISKIPKEYRDKVLLGNLIYKAIATPSDPHMKVLFTIWQMYIDPYNTSLSMDCSYCLGNILQGFKTMENALIQASKADKLLEL